MLFHHENFVFVAIVFCTTTALEMRGGQSGSHRYAM